MDPPSSTCIALDTGVATAVLACVTPAVRPCHRSRPRRRCPHRPALRPHPRGVRIGLREPDARLVLPLKPRLPRACRLPGPRRRSYAESQVAPARRTRAVARRARRGADAVPGPHRCHRRRCAGRRDAGRHRGPHRPGRADPGHRHGRRGALPQPAAGHLRRHRHAAGVPAVPEPARHRGRCDQRAAAGHAAGQRGQRSDPGHRRQHRRRSGPPDDDHQHRLRAAAADPHGARPVGGAADRAGRRRRSGERRRRRIGPAVELHRQGRLGQPTTPGTSMASR